MNALILYVVVDRNGKPRRTVERRLMVYERQAIAERYCKRDGDSVVEAVVDLAREPPFIKERAVGTT